VVPNSGFGTESRRRFSSGYCPALALRQGFEPGVLGRLQGTRSSASALIAALRAILAEYRKFITYAKNL
jgi:hypothetical protein